MEPIQHWSVEPLQGDRLKRRLALVWFFNRRRYLYQERLIELQHHAEIGYRSGCAGDVVRDRKIDCRQQRLAWAVGQLLIPKQNMFAAL